MSFKIEAVLHNSNINAKNLQLLITESIKTKLNLNPSLVGSSACNFYFFLRCRALSGFHTHRAWGLGPWPPRSLKTANACIWAFSSQIRRAIISGMQINFSSLKAN